MITAQLPSVIFVVLFSLNNNNFEAAVLSKLIAVLSDRFKTMVGILLKSQALVHIGENQAVEHALYHANNTP